MWGISFWSFGTIFLKHPVSKYGISLQNIWMRSSFIFVICQLFLNSNCIYIFYLWFCAWVCVIHLKENWTISVDPIFRHYVLITHDPACLKISGLIHFIWALKANTLAKLVLTDFDKIVILWVLRIAAISKFCVINKTKKVPTYVQKNTPS